MPLGPYYAEKELDAGFGSGDPAIVWLGFSLTSIANTGICTEPNQSCYRRLGIINNEANWPPAITLTAIQEKLNGRKFVFDPAEKDWGEIIDFVFFDASDAEPIIENILAYGTLVTAEHIKAGRSVTFAKDSIKIYRDLPV